MEYNIKNQKEFKNQIVEYIIEDLKSLNVANNIKSVIFIGWKYPTSPKNSLIESRYPFFAKISDISNFYGWVNDVLFRSTAMIKYRDINGQDI